MTKSGFPRLVLLAPAIVLFTMLPATADVVYWDTSVTTGLQAGDGVWDIGSTALWSSDTAGSNPLLTFSAGDDAVFAAPGTSTVTIASGGVTANSVTFNAGATGYIIAGGSGPLTISAASGTGMTANEAAVISANVALATDQTWAVGSSLTVSGVVSGAGLTKTGTGTLTLAGANTYTGNTVLNAGVLRAEGTNAGILGTGASQLILNGGTLGSYANTTSTINYGRNVAVGGDTTIVLGRLTTGSETTAATRQFGALSIGNATLNPRLDTTSFSAANVHAKIEFGDTTLTGDTTFNLNGFRKGGYYGTLTLANLTDNGEGHDLTLLGSWYYTSVLVTGNTSLSGDVTLGAGLSSQGPDLRIDNYTSSSLAGNLNLRGGVLSVNADVTRDLGAGAGQVRFTDGSQNGFSNHTSNRITVTIGDGEGGAAKLKWGTTLFNPGAFVLACREADTGGITLVNAIDLNGANRKFYNYGGSATAELAGLITNSGTNAAGIAQHTNSSGTTYLQNNANSFDGPVTVEGGTLRFDTIGDIGAGNSALGNPALANATITLGHSTDTRLYTGTLLYTGAGSLATNRPIRLNGNGTIRSSGSGTISFTADMIAPGAYDRVFTFTLGGTNTGDNIFGGKILDRSAASPTPVIKADAGVWVLTAANSYTGATIINGGTLAVSGSGTIANSALTINPTSAGATTATLDLRATSQAVASLTFGGTGARAGIPMAVAGTGTLALNGNVTYTSTNNPAGAAIAANVNLGAATRTFAVGNSTAAADDLTVSGVISGNSGVGLTKTGAGTLVLGNAANTYNGITTLNGGVLSVSTLANGGSPSSIGASSNSRDNLNFAAHSTLRYTGGTAVTDRAFAFASGQTGTFDIVESDTELTMVGRTSSGSGYLTKTGPGTLILSGANTYIGTTTVNAGTLKLGPTGSLAAGSYGLRILPTTSGVDATMDLNNRDWTITYTGTFNLVFGGTGAATGSDMLFSTGTGTLTLNNAASVITYTATNNPNGALFSGNLNLGGATRTFNIGDSTAAEHDLTISAAISGGSGAGLTKIGTGTLALSGMNTYSGPTTVTAGRLLVNGSHVGGDAYTVANTATLGGLGSIGSNVSNVSININSGGRLAPGASIGALEIRGNLAMDDDSVFEWEFNSETATADLLNLDGDLELDLSGGVVLSLVNLGSPESVLPYGTKLTMISYSEDWNGGIFEGHANGSMFMSGPTEWQIWYNDDSAGSNGGDFDSFVTLTVVPEPGTWLMLFVAMACAMLGRWRRK